MDGAPAEEIPSMTDSGSTCSQFLSSHVYSSHRVCGVAKTNTPLPQLWFPLACGNYCLVYAHISSGWFFFAALVTSHSIHVFPLSSKEKKTPGSHPATQFGWSPPPPNDSFSPAFAALLHAWLSYSFVDCATSIHLLFFDFEFSRALPPPQELGLASYCQVLVLSSSQYSKNPSQKGLFSLFNFPATPLRYHLFGGFFSQSSGFLPNHLIFC